MVFPRQTHGNPICAEVVIGIGVLLFNWYQIIQQNPSWKNNDNIFFELTKTSANKNSMVFRRQTHGNSISAEVVISIIVLFNWYQINQQNPRWNNNDNIRFEITETSSNINNIVFPRQTHGNPICAEVVIGIEVLLFIWYQIIQQNSSWKNNTFLT